MIPAVQVMLTLTFEYLFHTSMIPEVLFEINNGNPILQTVPCKKVSYDKSW